MHIPLLVGVAALVSPIVLYIALHYTMPGRVSRGAWIAAIAAGIEELLFLFSAIGSGQWGALVLHLVAFVAVLVINWDRLQLHRIFWPPSGHPHELPYTTLSQVEELLLRLAQSYPGVYMRVRWMGSLHIFIHSHPIGRSGHVH